MLMVTTPNIEGKEIKKYYGLVNGEGLIGANVYKDIFSGVRDVVGKNINIRRRTKKSPKNGNRQYGRKS